MARRLKTLQPGLRFFGGLAAAVLLVHWLVIGWVSDQVAGMAIDAAMAPRLAAVYVRQLELAPPPRPALNAVPPVVAAAPPNPQRVAAALPEPPASAASVPVDIELPTLATEEAAAQPRQAAAVPDIAPVEPPPDLLAKAAPPESAGPVEPVDGEDPTTVTSDADHAAAAQAFSWPASTRLSYVLTGNFRGDVHGSAQVEWINADPRYQVNLDVTIGLPFAPLLSRQMRSDGWLGPTGLRPDRYDQRSKMAFQEPRATSLRIGEQRVSTADGRPLPMPFGGMHPPSSGEFETSVQDSASQFVQLTWLFTTRPHLLEPGTTISFPLALPSRVAAWSYQVGPAQTLYTGFGPLEAYRVHTAPGVILGRDLLAEAWFAPQLAYLPVRIRIEQAADVYIDMVLKEKPQIAAR